MHQCFTTLALTLFGTTIVTEPASVLTSTFEEPITHEGYALLTSSCDGGYKGDKTDQPGACSHWTTYTTNFPGTIETSTRTETITVAPGSTVTSSFPKATQYSTTCCSTTQAISASPGVTTTAAQAQVTPPPVSGPSSSTDLVPSVSESSSISDLACIDEPVTLYGTVTADYFPGHSTSIGESTNFFADPVEVVTTTCVGGYKGGYTDACSSWSTSTYTTISSGSTIVPFTYIVTLPASTITSPFPTYTQSAGNCHSTTPRIGEIISNAGFAEATTPAQVVSTALPTESTTTSTAKISNHVGITAGAAGGIVLLSSSILVLFLRKRNAKRRGMKTDREASRYSPLNDGADGEERSDASEVKLGSSSDPDYMYGYGSSRIAVQHQNFPPSTPLSPLPPFTIERGQQDAST